MVSPTASGPVVALCVASLTGGPLLAQDADGPPAPPLFATVWIGGPLDSLYQAEIERLGRLCGSVDDACWREGIDTTSVPLVPVWTGPRSPGPGGRLAARLVTEGRWPGVVLLVQDGDGGEVRLEEDPGDWGYGATWPLADTAPDRIRPLFPEVPVPVWLPRSGGPGFGVLGVHGLGGRLWRLGPVRGRGRSDGEEVTLARGVYRVLDVEAGMVVLRAEIPSDMPCGEPAEADPDPRPTWTIPLVRLLDSRGVPLVEVAYPRGC